MRFTELFMRLIGGRRGRGPTPAKSELETLSRISTRRAVEFEPPGPRLQILLTDDIDPGTGKLYPDFQERRKRRREADQGESSPVAGGQDVSPD